MDNPLRQPLKILDRVNSCEQCVLTPEGRHQESCKSETDRRVQEIGKIERSIGCSNPIEIVLDVEQLQEVA